MPSAGRANGAGGTNIAGLKPADSWAEWASWTPEQVEQYREAREGVPHSGLQSAMVQHHAEWEEKFGFGPWGVAAMVETGETSWGMFEANLLTGRFDAARVAERLDALGYEGRDHQGHGYRVLPDGVSPEVPRPIGVLLRGHVGAVYAGPDMLFTAPKGEMVAEFLAVRTGDVKSVLTPEHLPMLEYEPRPDWGSLGDWEALAGWDWPLRRSSQMATVWSGAEDPVLHPVAGLRPTAS